MQEPKINQPIVRNSESDQTIFFVEFRILCIDLCCLCRCLYCYSCWSFEIIAFIDILCRHLFLFPAFISLSCFLFSFLFVFFLVFFSFSPLIPRLYRPFYLRTDIRNMVQKCSPAYQSHSILSSCFSPQFFLFVFETNDINGQGI